MWRLEARIARARRFTENALALSEEGPPWHRGIVAVATMLAALGIGLASKSPVAILVAPAVALFLALSDTEGPLPRRLWMLGLSAAFILIGGLASIAVRDQPIVFAVGLTVSIFSAGVLACAGTPFLPASRFGVIIALLLTNAPALEAMEFVYLVAMVAILAGCARATEYAIAPDRKVADFTTLAQAYFKLRANRRVVLRYSLAYTAAGTTAWLLGRNLDALHPTWLTVSTLVVMWPDALRSYERILQRVIGTLAGAVITVLLTSVVHDPYTLGAVALAMVFFLPHFIRRNYWLHSGLVVIFVMVSLEVSSREGLVRHFVAERVGDVLIGCGFALFGTVAAFGAQHRRARRARAQAVQNDAATELSHPEPDLLQPKKGAP